MEPINRIIPQLEKAASVMMTPSTAVTSEERHAAENIFLQFRRTKQPYNLCKQIFEISKVDYVLFESASTLKEAVVREWSLLEKADIDSLCSFLLTYVTHHQNLQKFVREQILQVVAIIFKRGTLDKSKQGCTNLLTSVSQLLRDEDKDMQLICCSILKALLTEYSSTSQASNLGLSLEYHAECKSTFETENLLTVFLLAVEVLRKFTEHQSTSFSRADLSVCIRYLSLAEQVLNWNFLSGNPFQLLRLSNETAKINLFRPPKFWKATVTDPSFISLFFKLYKGCINHEELAHHCLQCLIQLASLTGPVFQNQRLRIEYLSHFLNGFVQLMTRNHWTAMEAFGAASIVCRIVNVFPISVIASLPTDILKSFCETLASLTCSFQDLTIRKEEFESDSDQFEEAVDLLLDAWVILISNSSCFADGHFMPYAVQIFNSYIKVHLAVPDGLRKDDTDAKELDEIDCDVVEDDRLAYADELSDIGCISRLALPHVIPVLSNLIESRTNAFVNLIERLHSGDTSVAPDALFEDIHWLLLIATNVITTDTTSETASIPSEILQNGIHVQETCNIDVSANLQFMIGLGRNKSTGNVDRFMVLITRIASLIDIMTQALKSDLSQAVSPEIAGDTLWLLQCFTTAYLFTKETDDAKLPTLFKSAFAESSSCGRQLVGLILDIAETCLMSLSAEQSVAEDSVQLLLKLVRCNSRISVALEFPHLWRLANEHSRRAASLRNLPASVHRSLVQALMKFGSHIKEGATKERFWQQFLGPFKASYDAVLKHPNFDKIYQNDAVRQELIFLLETMRGVTLATDSTNADVIFQFLLPYLEDVLILLQKYANCPEMVELIIELFVDIVQTEIVYLNKDKSNALCGLCIHLIANYSKYNLGRIRAMKTSEDESYNEILLLIRLLTHILSKDYLDFSGDTSCSSENASALNAIDAVFHGLYIIIPLMNAELLKFPKLSTEYFKFITFVCECYPERIESLPEDLFNTLTASLDMALSHFGSDVAKNSLEALASISSHYFKNKAKRGHVPSQVDEALKHFLKIVLEFILASGFDMDLMQPASETLFILICCNQAEYMTLAQALLANQSDLGILQRLRNSFEELTPSSLQLSLDKQIISKFRKNLEKFLFNVKGFLCYK